MSSGARREAWASGQDVWAAVLESALDCVIVMDAHGIVREFNPAAQRTFGHRREDAVGRPLAELIIPPELRGQHHRGLQRYLESGEGPILGRRIEIEGVRADGSRLPVELAVVPFLSAGERLFAGYLRDLTERVRAQEEIRRRTALARLLLEVPLAASRATTIEQAVGASLESVCAFTGWPVGHAYFLDPTNVTLASRGTWCVQDHDRYAGFIAASEGTAFRQGEGLPGRAWAEGKPVWVEDLGADLSLPRQAPAQAAGLGAALAFPVAVEGQTLLVLEFFAAGPKEHDPDLLGALDLVANELGRVVERVRSAEELRRVNEELREQVQARQRFLSQAAHELGSPLSAIRMQMALLERVAGGGPAAKHLAVLDRNVKRLQVMARDLSDAGRIGAGRMVLERQPQNLRAIVQDSVQSAEPAAHAKGVALAYECGDVEAHLDRERIGQVLDNLLHNALRFTPEGGRIVLRARPDRDAVVVEVEDTGYGIEPSDLLRLFQPFSQVHDEGAGNVGGSGLGLFISRGIARAHGGDLTAASAGRGKGSRFTLRLPLR